MAIFCTVRIRILWLCATFLVAFSQLATGQDGSDAFANEAFQNRTVKSKISDRFEIYNPHSLEHLETIKEMGFHQVVLDWPNLHSEATKVGLDVVIANWWTKDTQPGEIDERLKFLKEVDPARLAAVSMMDEPERYAPETPFSFYESLYRSLRPRLAGQSLSSPLEISHWGPLASWQIEDYRNFVTLYRATDRIRLMPYPDLDEGPLDEVFYQMMRSRYIMQLAGKEIPQIVILQTWVIPEAPKLPTIKELRVMAYQAILCGAQTISFFNYDPDVWKRTPGFRNGFRELMSELTDFTERIRDRQCEATMSEDGTLVAQIEVSHDQLLTVHVNTHRQAVGQLAALEVRTEMTTRPTPLAANPVPSDSQNVRAFNGTNEQTASVTNGICDVAPINLNHCGTNCQCAVNLMKVCRQTQVSSTSDCRPAIRRFIGRRLRH